MDEKSYQDLKRDVWETGLCAGCGACVAVCPADALYFKPGEGSLYPQQSGYCKQATDGVPCGACVAVCPRTAPMGEMRAAPAASDLIGQYLEITAGRAAFDLPGRQSGGAVTAILLAALERGLIDAVVAVTEDRWTHRPASVVITESEVLVRQAGSRYAWWVPLVAALKEAVVARKYKRIAVVGVPCVAAAVRRMRESDNDLVRPFGRSIRLVIGLFCTESFDYAELVGKVLGREHRIEPWQIERLNVAGKLEVTASGRRLELPLKAIDGCVRPGCRVCTDLTATGADISAGAVGSPDGYTTLIVRTPEGRGFVDAATTSGRLALSDDIDLPAIERLAARKRKRGTASTA